VPGDATLYLIPVNLPVCAWQSRPFCVASMFLKHLGSRQGKHSKQILPLQEPLLNRRAVESIGRFELQSVVD
jgi:hypothetical protein